MICGDPFKNLNIVARQDTMSISPCCMAPEKPVTLLDFSKDPYLTEVRQQWLDNTWPTACESCKKMEDHGQISRRIGSNQWYQDHNQYNTDIELIRLDYWVGDLCNLACVICGPENSSSWRQELNLPLADRRTKINRFWKDLDLEKLQFVHFNGGEPLLSKEHRNFLEAIPKKNQVHLNYNTNGTVRPDSELLELWDQFQLVQLDFSIDDIGARFEYQRYPAKWNQVTENLMWFRDHGPHNCMYAVNTTVSVLNQPHLTELDSWLKHNFSQNQFTDPIEHRKQWAVGLMAVENSANNFDKITKFLNACDARRGTDWRNTFPILQQLNK